MTFIFTLNLSSLNQLFLLEPPSLFSIFLFRNWQQLVLLGCGLGLKV